jgi:hypothetical protein
MPIWARCVTLQRRRPGRDAVVHPGGSRAARSRGGPVAHGGHPALSVARRILALHPLPPNPGSDTEGGLARLVRAQRLLNAATMISRECLGGQPGTT